jgi:hypothetical protein
LVHCPAHELRPSVGVQLMRLGVSPPPSSMHPLYEKVVLRQWRFECEVTWSRCGYVCGVGAGMFAWPGTRASFTHGLYECGADRTRHMHGTWERSRDGAMRDPLAFKQTPAGRRARCTYTYTYTYIHIHIHIHIHIYIYTFGARCAFCSAAAAAPPSAASVCAFRSAIGARARARAVYGDR